jgi:hypothetical protein
MTPQRNIWRGFTADWKPTLALALPMFAVVMWFGIARGYADIGLFAFAMAASSWHLAGWMVLLPQKIMQCTGKRQGDEKRCAQND